jgi:hypothetical protein
MDQDAAKFVMEFVDASDTWRSQFESIWQETLDNFFVRPIGSGFSVGDPYRSSQRLTSAYSDRFVLKDPETHRAVMKYASSLMRTIFGDRRGEYLRAEPVGYEDVDKADVTTRLLRRFFSGRGIYRTMAEAFTDLGVFGTTVLKIGHEYREQKIPIRTVGPYEDRTDPGVVAARDGPSMRQLPVMDFYPDPYEDRLERMCGAAERFQVSPYYAESMAAKKIWNADGVADAKLSKSGGKKREYPLSGGYPDPAPGGGPGAPLIGFEYNGDYKDGERYTIVVLEGELVRFESYIYADTELPWYDLVMNPVAGRFYGLAPAEVMRYDQDLADCLKELAARAVIRSVHPPIAYDPDSDVDKDLLRFWFADMPIPVRGGPNSVGTIQYNTRIADVFAMQQRLTADMQAGGGASGSLLGDPGPDREAASVGALRYQAASDVLEFAAGVLERDCLPAVGLAVLRRYQQFLAEEDLPRLVGELPNPVPLGTIMGDFDVRFTGSRLAATRAQKLAAYDRLVALSQVPAVQLQVPWPKLLERMIGDLMELPEVAAEIATGTQLMPNAMAMALAQGGKGAPAPASPSGASTTMQELGAAVPAG